MLRRAISAAGAAACLGGCVLTGQLHDMAVGYNEAVAQATDSVMLLNILRARDRRPMHFTSISAFRGALSADASASLSAGVGGEAQTSEFGGMLALTKRTIANGANTFTPGASGKVSTSPSFDLAVHDTQKFYRGFLSSVDAATVHHFLRQGWRADLITYLFVEEVKVWETGKGKDEIERELRQRFENDPDDKDKAAAFASFVKCYTLSATTKVSDDTALFSLLQLRKPSLGDIDVLDGEKFDYASPDSNNSSGPQKIVRKGGTSASLGLQKNSHSTCDPKTGAQAAVQDSGQSKAASPASATALDATLLGEISELISSAQFKETNGSVILGDMNADIKIEIEIVLRSVQGVLYFLGEYIRPTDFCPYMLSEAGGAQSPLFVARSHKGDSGCVDKKNEERDAAVAVHFEGKRYWIPPASAGGGRSLQVLALVEQLFNLQKSGEDRPATQTVRVVQ